MKERKKKEGETERKREKRRVSFSAPVFLKLSSSRIR